MGQKLDFNIEEAGIKIDGAVIDASRNFEGSVASDRLLVEQCLQQDCLLLYQQLLPQA